MRELFGKYLSGDLTREELQLLLDQMDHDETGAKDLLSQAWEDLAFTERELELSRKSKLRKIRFIRVAAVFILLAGIAAYYLVFNPQQKPVEIVKTTKPDIAAPTVSRATLTLANGTKIYLDSLQNGSLHTQSGEQIEKQANGEIVYTGTSTNSQTVTYNTIVNPKGSKVVSLVLADGSKVWLNAASTLTYPSSMNGDTRKVELTGEAYFEIAHNAAKPFLARNLVKNVEVQVLGTHFNMNTYEDEEKTKITLLEGSVKVSKGNHSSLLKPGQQAEISESIQTNDNVDIEAVMAWKDGMFDFKDADVQTIMRQVARWYNVEVVYAGKIPQHEFTGKTKRTDNVSQVLKILELYNIRIRIEEPQTAGKAGKIIVNP